MRKIFLCLFLLQSAISIVHAQCYTLIVPGAGHTIAIKEDGTLWAWGQNAAGALGDGTTIDRNIAIQIGTDNNWKTLAAGENHSLGVRTDGTLWAWGDNFYGELGIGSDTDQYNPIQVGNSNDWKSVFAGNYRSFAIKKNGTLWGWGAGGWGALGIGNIVFVDTPTQVDASTNWESIVTGWSHTIAIKTDGTLWSWGYNKDGELGDASPFMERDTPGQIGFSNDWKSIETGYFHTFAFKKDGTLWAWGFNQNGELGDGTTINRYVPIQIDSANEWKTIKAGYLYNIGIKNDGSIWAWGDNSGGQFGDGTTISDSIPRQRVISKNWKNVIALHWNTFGIKDDGSLWGWGYNMEGELGDWTNTSRSVPVPLLCTNYKIRGKAFTSTNTNCTKDVGEKSFSNILIATNPKGFGGITDSLGKYTIYSTLGTYEIKPVYPPYLKPLLKNLVCPVIGSYNIKIDSFAIDTSNFDFAQEVFNAPLLQVEFTQNRLRRCYNNSGIIKYCNLGTSDTDHVKIIVVLPPDVSYTSSSKTPSINGKTLTFDIGLLKAGECGTIGLVTSVDCINGLTGQTRCFKIGISPSNKTYKNLVNKPGFDNSMVSVEGTCLGSLINFSISNSGENMSDSSSYRIYKDGLLANNGKFKLVKNETKSIDIAATGHTYRLEADQSTLYPTNSNPNASVENCGAGASSHLGFITKLPDYEENLEFKEHCIIIRDSYDPNEKSVTPSGIGAVHQVMHNALLHYNINFQNTGNDTAYKVVIKDTLSKDFDLSTLLINGASHPYSIKFTGENVTVINFIFDNIQLPDSTTNEKKSHGFISYSITPQATIANGTAITNTADIYFDYNLPVRTNTTGSTIDDRWPITNEKLGLNNSQSQNININPNPAKNKIRITNYELREGSKYLVYNTIGQIVLEGEIKEKTKIIDISSLESGIYFLNLNGSMKKFVVN